MCSAWLPNLFMDRESSDVQLRIDMTALDCEAVLPAHSLVLKFASKVFRAMLDTTNFKEARTGIVELKVNGNMDDAIFFLRYLYTRELEHVDLHVYVSLLHTAHLYEVDDLARLCNERIVKQITPLTVCRTYISVKNVATPCLLSNCQKLMLKFAFLVFQKNLHLSLDEQTMGFLLASDKLNVLDEEQALEALCNWGRARLALEECSGKSAEMCMDKLLRLIRWPQIKNVGEDSPLFTLWKIRKETGHNSSARQSCRTCLNKFSEVTCLAKFSDKTSMVPADCDNNCLMMFSVDKLILLSGFGIQVNVGEKLTPECIFHFSLSQEDVIQLGAPEVVLEVVSKVKDVQFNTQAGGKIRHNAQYDCYDFLNEPASYFTTQEYQTSEPKYGQQYIYNLTINLQKPIVLKPAEPIFLNVNIKPMPRTRILLSTRTFPAYDILNFEPNLRVRLWKNTVAVNRMFYFVK